MVIIRAAHLGMCFGVRDAIQLAELEVQKSPGRLVASGPLVHNEHVTRRLQELGLTKMTDLPGPTERLLVTAHGASDRQKAEWRARAAQVVDATCPLVHFAHRSLRRLVDEGCYPVIIGQAGHVEVRGLAGDLDSCSIILEEKDVELIPRAPRYGVVAQTTQPVRRVRHLVNAIRQRFSAAEIRWVDTVCQPTKQRQAAASELARQVQVVIVVGGAHSNNTRELCRTCEEFCPRVHAVQEAAGLRAAWFQGIQRAGLTAGTSTPDHVIDAVEEGMRRLAEWVMPPDAAHQNHPPHS